MAKSYSDKGLVTETLVINTVNSNFNRHEIGISFYSDESLTTLVTASGLTGSFTLNAIPASNEYLQPVQGSPFNVSVKEKLESPVTTSVALKYIEAVPSNIQGATHWVINVVGLEG